MATIEIDGLVKRFGALTAVDGLSLTVERGEVVGVVGPNGAGKTTTVDCLLGLQAPDAGRVRVLALDPAREVEVLDPVRHGAGNRDIAARLHISEATVKTHLLHAYARLGVNDRTAAVVVALERGVLTL